MARLPTFALRVANLGRSITFYHDQLGFGLEARRDEADVAVIIDSDGDPLLLAGPGTADLAPYLSEEHFVLDRNATLTFQGGDLEARRAELAQRGVVDARMSQTAIGDHVLTVTDPDGYQMAFLTPVSRTREEMLALYLRVPGELDAALAGLSEADLDLRREPGEWSIRQIMHHLVDGDTLQLLPRIKFALMEANRAYLSNSWDTDTWARKLYVDLPLGPALALFRATHAYIGELVRRQPDVWDRSVEVTFGGADDQTLRIGDRITGLTRHAYDHIGEIQRVREVHGR